MLIPETLEQLEQLAKKELKAAQELSIKLQLNFGDTIPVNQNVEVSAANIAYMNNTIEEYSKVKLALLKIKDAKSINIGDGLEVKDEGMMAMYQLGITAALELILNPNVDFI